MTCHIIGNGPTKEMFNPSEQQGVVFGCNFGTKGFNETILFIHDRRPFNHLQTHKMKLNSHVVCRPGHKVLALREKDAGRIPSYELLDRSINEKSSGHDAIIWSIKKGYKEIHLWGFDSLSQGIVDSDSKEKIDGSRPNPNKLPMWNDRFGLIWKMARMRKVHVHLHRKDLVQILA